MHHSSTENDPKVRATAAIWGCAVGMLRVSIALDKLYGVMTGMML